MAGLVGPLVISGLLLHSVLQGYVRVLGRSGAATGRGRNLDVEIRANGGVLRYRSRIVDGRTVRGGQRDGIRAVGDTHRGLSRATRIGGPEHELNTCEGNGLVKRHARIRRPRRRQVRQKRMAGAARRRIEVSLRSHLDATLPADSSWLHVERHAGRRIRFANSERPICASCCRKTAMKEAALTIVVPVQPR